MSVIRPVSSKCLAWLSTTVMTVVPVVASIGLHCHPLILWNASASVPKGLYLLNPRQPEFNELAVAYLPTTEAKLAASRHYLPLGLPVIKHVAAIAGQAICRDNDLVLIDGTLRAKAKLRDHQGRPLPVWQGCQVLSDTEVLLLNSGVSDSFDGRYFGKTPRNTIIGTASPLFTDEPGPGHFTRHISVTSLLFGPPLLRSHAS